MLLYFLVRPIGINFSFQSDQKRKLTMKDFEILLRVNVRFDAYTDLRNLHT